MPPVSGSFGAADLQANTPTLLYQAPAGITATVFVSMCNRGGATAKIRLAIGSGAAPANTDYLEYDWPLAARYPYFRKCVVGAGQKVWVVSDVATVSAQCTGFEETA